MSIPTIIHQTLPSKQDIHPAFLDNIANLKRLNPRWEHRLYDDEDIPPFILQHFGKDILDCFNLIDPRYGAARADFFRYLLMYVEGGVYLDIKSTAIRPLDEVLRNDDQYILSHWRNKQNQEFAAWGRWPGLGPEGEYQQWHIICAPRHKFLDSVIEAVRRNITSPCAGQSRAGHPAVVTVTGPVAYTRAIQPISGNHPHRKVDIQDLGFRYTVLSNTGHHNKLSQPHYSTLEFPLLRLKHVIASDEHISASTERIENGATTLLNAAFMTRSNCGSAKIITSHGTSLFYDFQLDRCFHEDNAGNSPHVPVQFELFGSSLSFFVKIGGIRIRLGVSATGSLTSQFDAEEQGAPPLFTIARKDDGLITIAWKVHFLCAEPGGKLAFNRTTAKQWESFSGSYNLPKGAVRDYVETPLSTEAPRACHVRAAKHIEAGKIFDSFGGPPSWAEHKVSICREIAAHFAPFKILLKTKDEPDRLKAWIAHHTAIVGPQNLIIFDNMSTDPAVLELYNEFRGRIPIVRFTQYHNMVHDTNHYAELYSALRASCRYFTFLDTDEHLALYDGDERFLFGEAVSAFLAEKKPATIFPATWLSNVTGFNDFFDLSYPHDYLSSGLKWGKPIISADCELSKFINHNTQIDHCLFPKPLTTNFFILHRRAVSREERIKANLRKLAAIELISPSQGATDVLNLDIENVTPLTARDYCREIRELAAAGQTTELPSARSIEICTDGRIRWTENWQHSDMRRFIAFPEEYSAEMFSSS